MARCRSFQAHWGDAAGAAPCRVFLGLLCPGSWETATGRLQISCVTSVAISSKDMERSRFSGNLLSDFCAT